MNKAERLKRSKGPQVTERFGGRLPPGQVLTEKFPILTVGEVPSYDLDQWDFQMTGGIGDTVMFSYNDLMALPQSKVICDVHCVTRWSKFDNGFEGVLLQDLLEDFEIPDDIQYVMVHGDYDYTANIPLKDLLAKGVILAHSYNGKPLTEKHGYPFRLVIPHLYFWKSVKWIRGFEFRKSDAPGFWEQNGFHNEADPFKEQRFSDEGDVMEEDKWKEKDFDY
ncbi:sulfite oxidase-like oxidoreductase [Halobacillus shinanisalinarum]|uniref:Sulfite oxidase-like oxidoreductase n=1 Tax=Halobacillus shinanisalinarum TaxID=2932258 RepID=A0ABY4GWP4_9BACI|nr:sulfite oxidase-like oxidoreductase [Halobacillus shinanisalinarum]UOQ92592.1 sulfite oxidase-like oxidoreductase [Halobacillus shinanisalinarum]